jgi:hypothetical protein
MKKKLLITAFLIGIYTLNFAQTTSNSQGVNLSSFSKSDELKRAFSNTRAATAFDDRYEGVKGSPYLFETWTEGRLTLSDSALVKEIYLFKFDLTENEVRIKIAQQERILSNRELQSLELKIPSDASGKSVILKKIKLPDNDNRHLFGIYLFEGKQLSLYKHIKKVFKKANLEDKGIVTLGNPFDSFEETTTLYLRRNNNSPEKTALKKNDIIFHSKLSKANMTTVNNYCKEHEISGKLTEEEAISLLTYIDSLNL